VTFRNVKYRELKDGQCHRSFFTGASYRNTKAKVNRQKQECNKRKGAIKAFQKAVTDARRARDDLRRACRNNTLNNMNSMYGRATRLCNSGKNRKMWTRAKHMICVLKKSTLAGCHVPSLPKITKPALDFTMCTNGGEEQFSRRIHQYNTGWYGHWDGVANFNCPGTRVMNGQGSYHNNHREDRRWSMKCTDIVSRDSRGRTGYQQLAYYRTKKNGRYTGLYDVHVNGWNQNFHRDTLCGNDGLMRGAWSRHENRFEDRVFVFRCQKYKGIRLENKSWAGWCNWYDRQCNYQCPGNKVMIGVASERSNGHRDRRFRYQCADVKFVQKSVPQKAKPAVRKTRRACTTKETMGKTFYAYARGHCYRIVVGKSLDQDYRTKNPRKCNAKGFRKSVSIGHGGGINTWWENGTRAPACKGKSGRGRNEPRRSFLKLSQGADRTYVGVRESPTCNYHINVAVASCTETELNFV